MMGWCVHFYPRIAVVDAYCCDGEPHSQHSCNIALSGNPLIPQGSRLKILRMQPEILITERKDMLRFPRAFQQDHATSTYRRIQSPSKVGIHSMMIRRSMKCMFS